MILVSGSSGHLGEALVRTLRQAGRTVRGVDILPGECTDMVGSISEIDVAQAAMQGVQAVLHTATLHKPHVVTHSRQQFIDTNISGTLNLLEAAVHQKVQAFIYTSTTSAFGDAMAPAKELPAAWVTEDMPPEPKNIYGVTKTAAEDLCSLFARNMDLPCVVLRTSRFFPEADDDELQRSRFQDANLKVLEFLYRRVAIDDVVSSHLRALECAAKLTFGKFIISASSPFGLADLPQLRRNPASVIEQYYPGTRAAFDALHWQFPSDIDRVYVNQRARDTLAWRPQYDFASVLSRVRAGQDWRSALALRIGKKGYHERDFGDIPFPV
jgi:UDP-glucose 4-epimerase